MGIRATAVIVTALLVIGILLILVGKAADEGKYILEYDVYVGGKLYTFIVKLSVPRYIADNSLLVVKGFVSLSYTPSLHPEEKVYVTLMVKVNNSLVASYPLGFMGLGDTRAFNISVFLPSNLFGNISSISVGLKVYYNASFAETWHVVPCVNVRGLAFISLDARFIDTGSAYTVAVLGRDTTKQLVVLVENPSVMGVAPFTVKVYVDEKLVYVKIVPEGLTPGSKLELNIAVPVPFSKGVHVVRVEAIGSDGAWSSSTKAYIVVIPRMKLSIIPLNSSQVFEGEKLCFELKAINIPGYVEPRALYLEYRVGDSEWSTAAVLNGSGGIACFRAPSVGYLKSAKLNVRGRLELDVDGLVFNVTSPTLTLVVYSLSSIGRSFSLQAVAVNPRVYVVETIKLRVVVSPPIRVCVPGLVEVFNEKTSMWDAVKITRICGGDNIIGIDASKLGEGMHVLQVVVSVNGFEIYSNTVTVYVYGQPRVNVNVSPSLVPPGSRLNVAVSVKPYIKPYMVKVKPSWANYTLDIGPVYSKSTLFMLLAPLRPGDYSINVNVSIGKLTLPARAVVRVVSPVLNVNVTPSTVKVGGKLRVNARVEPPLTLTARLQVVGPNGTTVLEKDLEIINGFGSTEIRAPQTPGTYTVRVFVKKFNISSVARFNVERVVYGVDLTIEPSEVNPGGKVHVRVKVSPPPPAGTSFVVMLEKNGKWEVVASGVLASKGTAEADFKAPSEPGVYGVKAVVPSLNSESNIVTFKVVSRRARPPSTQQLVPGVAAVAVAIAFAWSLRAIRRR